MIKSWKDYIVLVLSIFCDLLHYSGMEFFGPFHLTVSHEIHPSLCTVPHLTTSCRYTVANTSLFISTKLGIHVGKCRELSRQAIYVYTWYCNSMFALYSHVAQRNIHSSCLLSVSAILCLLPHRHTGHFPPGCLFALLQLVKNEMGVLTSTAWTCAFSINCWTSSCACSPVRVVSTSSVAAHCPKLTSRLSWVKWTAQSTKDWRCLQQTRTDTQKHSLSSHCTSPGTHHSTTQYSTVQYNTVCCNFSQPNFSRISRMDWIHEHYLSWKFLLKYNVVANTMWDMVLLVRMTS